MNHNIKSYLPGIIIAIITIVIGLEIYQDYGVSWDEPSQRDIGVKTYQYAIGEYPEFTEFYLRDHSPGFEWPLMMIEKALSLENYRDIFLMRHLASFIIFVLSMFLGYVFILKLFNNKWLAAFAMLALIFHPRMFAHGFFNPKDIPALNFFLFSLIATHWAFKKKKLLPFIVLGIICGYSACIRIMNLVIMAPIAIFFLYDLIKAIRNKQGYLKTILHSFVVVIFSLITLYISWPTLWEDPIAGLKYVFESYSKFALYIDILTRGLKYKSADLPWDYIPIWFCVTMPLLWLILGTIGGTLISLKTIKKPFKTLDHPIDRTVLLALITFCLPVIVVILMNSVVYDDWRHVYFIYPSFVILVTYGLKKLTETKAKLIVVALCFVQFGMIASFMIKYHPYQQVYFNELVSHEKDSLYYNYELDYWGACYLQALEWVADHDDRQKIVINRTHEPMTNNYNFLPDITKQRIVLTDNLPEMDYYVQFFRTAYYRFPGEERPDAEIVYEERVLNSPIYRIVKLR